MSYVQELIRNEPGVAHHLYMTPERRIYKQTKVKLAAYHGDLDNYLTKGQLDMARTYGLLPSSFNVHHIIPLCCQNTQFDCQNLAICSRDFHEWLHKFVYEPVLSKMQYGDKVHLVLPDWKPVNTMQNIDSKFKQFYEGLKNGHYKDVKYFNIERVRD